MELVVVLLLIVLLLAILLPQIIYHIDEAKQNAEVSETRTVCVALQAILSLEYADTNIDRYFDKRYHDNVMLTKEGHDAIENLSAGTLGKVDHIVFSDDNKIMSFVYWTLNGSKVLYEIGSYEVLYLY